jgi:hypothetical protein
MRLSLLVLGFTIMAYLPLTAQEQSCSAVISTPSASITFLEQQKGARQSPCISSVIKRLGQNRDVHAVHLLVSYLDFVDPSTARSPGATANVRPAYPAIEALFQIGQPAASELMSAIGASESAIIRQNAAKAYLSVYRDDLASGVRQLQKEGLITKSAEARHRLSEAQTLLIGDCSKRTEPEAQSCRDAAGKN